MLSGAAATRTGDASPAVVLEGGRLRGLWLCVLATSGEKTATVVAEGGRLEGIWLCVLATSVDVSVLCDGDALAIGAPTDEAVVGVGASTADEGDE